MEGLPVLVSVGASGLIPLAKEVNKWCIARIKEAHEHKVCAVILPHGCGKSEIARQLHGDNVIVVDLDNAVRAGLSPSELEAFDNQAFADEQAHKIRYMREGRKIVNELKDDFTKKGVRLIVLCNDPEISQFVGVKPQNTFLCCPSNALYQALHAHASPERKSFLDKKRLEFIINYKDSLYQFDDFKSLYDALKRSFMLKSKL